MASFVDDKSLPNRAGATEVTTSTLAATDRLADLKLVAGFVDFNDKGLLAQDRRGYWLGAQYTLGKHLLKGLWGLAAVIWRGNRGVAPGSTFAIPYTVGDVFWVRGVYSQGLKRQYLTPYLS